jgi:carbon monoxide dehydrogenase subunit G
MIVEGQFVIHAPPERVWEIINDPKQMRQCMPGCAALEALGNDEYRAVLEIGVATLRGSFEARLRLSDKRPPTGYRIDVQAAGMTGEMQGGGTVTLAPQGLGTALTYAGELQVVGLIATIGQRFLAGVVEQMTADFFQGLGKVAETEKELATDGHR